MTVVPDPFDRRPPPVESADPVGETLEDAIAHAEQDTRHLEQVHFRQELRRRVERERTPPPSQEETP